MAGGAKIMPMTPEQRVERAKTAAAARWGKVDWAAMPIEEAVSSIAELRDELEKASRIVQQRITAPAQIQCCMCPKLIPQGRWAQNRSYIDRATGLIQTIYFCSARCVTIYNKRRQDEIMPGTGVEAVPA